MNNQKTDLNDKSETYHSDTIHEENNHGQNHSNVPTDIDLNSTILPKQIAVVQGKNIATDSTTNSLSANIKDECSESN